jgi:hypothetical protein
MVNWYHARSLIGDVQNGPSRTTAAVQAMSSKSDCDMDTTPRSGSATGDVSATAAAVERWRREVPEQVAAASKAVLALVSSDAAVDTVPVEVEDASKGYTRT